MKLKKFLIDEIAFVVLFILLSAMFLPRCENFHDEVGERLKNDPRPIGPSYNYSHPNNWPKD